MFNLKISASIVVIISTFLAGFKYASALYQVERTELVLQYTKQIKEKTDEYRAKEQRQTRQLVDAWDQLEQARAESVDLRADVERVRKLADSYRTKLSGTDSDSCDALRERLAGCTKLLQEGADLSAEGAKLSGEIAVKKDAISKLCQIED